MKSPFAGPDAIGLETITLSESTRNLPVLSNRTESKMFPVSVPCWSVIAKMLWKVGMVPLDGCASHTTTIRNLFPAISPVVPSLK